MYYAFGDNDVVGICDFPDDASATAVSLIINSSDAVSLKLTPLMTIACSEQLPLLTRNPKDFAALEGFIVIHEV